jgi:hypothetical protein
MRVLLFLPVLLAAAQISCSTAFGVQDELLNPKSEAELILAKLDTRKPFPKGEELLDLWQSVLPKIQQAIANVGPGEIVKTVEATVMKDSRYGQPEFRLASQLNLIEFALKKGEYEYAWQNVDKITRLFKYPDEMDKRVEILGGIISRDDSPETKDLVFDLLIPKMEEALQRDQIESVADGLTKFENLAKRKMGRDLKKTLADWKRRVKDLGKAFKSIQPAIQVLKSDPENQAANFAIGKYYFEAKKQYFTGARFLARGPKSNYSEFVADVVATTMLADKMKEKADKWWAIHQRTALPGEFVDCIGYMYHMSLRRESGIADKQAYEVLDRLYRKQGAAKFKSIIGEKLTLHWDDQAPSAFDAMMINKDGSVSYVRHRKDVETLRWYFYQGCIHVRWPDSGYYLKLNRLPSNRVHVAFKYFWTDKMLKSAFAK